MSLTHTSKILVFISACVWAVAWVTPTVNGAPGLELVEMAFVWGWRIPQFGPWAVLANVTIPLTCYRVFEKKQPLWPLCLSFGFPATSPAYWHFLGRADGTNWGVWAWTASILILAVAASVSKVDQSRVATRTDAMPVGPKDLFDINPAGPCVALKSDENVAK